MRTITSIGTLHSRAGSSRSDASSVADCDTLPAPCVQSASRSTFEIIDLGGNGVVYSYAILHHPQNPAFEYPVLAALIDLDEGVRVLSNLVDVDPHDIVIGMPVTVDFRPTRHDGAVPVFKPKATADG